MSTNVTLNGSTYAIPAEGDSGWGTVLSNYFIAIGSGVLQKTGGSFTLTAETDFGATYGLKSAYFKSRAANPASAGALRLGNTESLKWRNAANNADLDLTVNASDQMQFNGATMLFGGAGSIVNADINAAAAIDYSKLNLSLSIVNADVSSSAAIVYSKLALSNSIVNTDIGAAAAIAYSKLNLSTSIVNADVSGSAAIAYSKLNLATSIVNADISAGAAIVYSKLSIADSDLTIAKTSGLQTALDDKVAKTLTTTTGDMIYASAANTPARLPIGSAGQVLKQVGGLPTWATFSGGINYLSSNPDAEADTAGWATYADAAGSTPVDGTGGAADITWTRSTSSPLRGTASFLFTKDAANRQGQGSGFDFSIDSTDQAKVLQISCDYKIASGTYADGDLTCYIYDVTNAAIIQPAGYSIVNAGVSMAHKATFQSASNSTSYRLIIHCASTSAVAYTVQFDNFAVGPQVVTQGAAVTDWQSFTPTGSWVSNATYTGQWRRVGDVGEYAVTVTTSGAPTATQLAINLPSGQTIDTAKMPSTANNPVLGYATATDNATANYIAAVLYQTTTSVAVVAESAGSTYVTNGGMTNTIPFTFGNLDSVDVLFTAPIVGWSSNVQLSSDTDTRVVAARIYKNGTQAFSTETKVTGWTVDSDKTGMWDATNNRFNVLVPGDYVLAESFYSVPTTAASQVSVYRVNGGASVYFGNGSQSDINDRISGSTLITNLRAGDYVEMRLFTDAATTVQAGTGNTHVEFYRLSGPATVAASESVNFRVADTSSAAIGTSIAIYKYQTVTFDSHNAYSTTTGLWTAPISGRYQVNASLFTASLVLTGNIYIALYKNGSIYSILSYNNSAGAGSLAYPLAGSDEVQLLAGDTLAIWAVSGTAATGSGTAGANHWSITRVGNY